MLARSCCTCRPAALQTRQAVCRLLGSFQATLEEVTLIALPPEQAPAAKAVQIHSFNDPAKGTLRGAAQLPAHAASQRSTECFLCRPGAQPAHAD